MRNLLSVIGLALLLSGCATLINRDAEIPREAALRATYPPKPVNYQELVKEAVSHRLKDPLSAQYKGWLLAKAYQASSPPKFGWFVSVDVNAKNSYGGYVGFQTWFYWIDTGQARDVFTLPYRVHQVEIVDGP